VQDNLEGKTGLVTDRVPPGGTSMGEVMISGQAYFALSVDPEAELAKGTRVVVVDHLPPRTVLVTPY
jgi:membrane protein implicated in regulation of membrane protease activity